MCNTAAILAQALCLNAGWDALLRAGTPAAQKRDRSLPPGVAWLLRRSQVYILTEGASWKAR
eukprot:10472542-Heterocapsa_arctica.AAC.1